MPHFASFFSSSKSSNNLARSNTISSESSTRSSSSTHHGTSSTRSSTSTLPTSSSFSNLLDAAKDYVFGEPRVFYPPSSSGRSLKAAKGGLGDEDGGGSSEGGSAAGVARRSSLGGRSRASSTASSSSSVAAVVLSSFERSQGAAAALGGLLSESGDETDTLRGRERRNSISSQPKGKISFSDAVRTHRRSRSATPSDRNRLIPSASCPTKLLSPLPEISRISDARDDSRASSSSPTSTIHSLGDGPATPTRRKPMSPSARSTATLTEGGDTDDDDEHARWMRTPFEGKGGLKFSFAGDACRSQSSLASSSESVGGRPPSPTKRLLQGRRSAGLRSFGTPTSLGASSSDMSRSSTPARSRPLLTSPTLVIELVVPTSSPPPPRLELPPLPRSTTTSSLRPRSRRTYSLPFAPHLEPPSDLPCLGSSSSNGPSPGSSIASNSTSNRSPFFDPSSSLKADQPETTVTTVAQSASLSNFSSWAETPEMESPRELEPSESRHRALVPPNSYDLSFSLPRQDSSPYHSSSFFTSSSVPSRSFPVFPLTSMPTSPPTPTQNVRTPSSSPSLSLTSTSPGRRPPISVERALSQPLLHSSRSLSKSFSSSSSSTSSSPSTMGPPPVPLRRAATVSNPQRLPPPSYSYSDTRPSQSRINSRSTSPVGPPLPLLMGVPPTHSSRRAQPKMRHAHHYSYTGVRYGDQPPLPYSGSRSYAPSSPSGSSEGGGGGPGGDLSWISPLSSGRRGSHSSQSSLRLEVYAFEDASPVPSSSSSSTAGSLRKTESAGRPGLWRSASSAVSLTGLLAAATGSGSGGGGSGSGGLGLVKRSSLRESTTERERRKAAEEEEMMDREREREREREEAEVGVKRKGREDTNSDEEGYLSYGNGL